MGNGFIDSERSCREVYNVELHNRIEFALEQGKTNNQSLI